MPLTREDVQLIRETIRAAPEVPWWRKSINLLVAALLVVDGAELAALVDILLTRS
jgi:hypothetical protein